MREAECEGGRDKGKEEGIKGWRQGRVSENV